MRGVGVYPAVAKNKTLHEHGNGRQCFGAYFTFNLYLWSFRGLDWTPPRPVSLTSLV